MNKLLNIFILTFIFSQITFAENYLWPTNSSDKLSATFGEYRSGHFHAGIDIKTNNTNGYPCYAIESGYISRVITKPFGYGKAVYLKLNDGNIVVYAHLDGFADKLDSLVKNEQKSSGKYSITKYFKKDILPVKKGEIIAYTGSSGTKYPHLHFEIRDGNHNPINPLQFNSLSIVDNTPPQINKIAIVPVGGNTLINNSPENLILKPTFIKTGIYRITKPIIIKGDFAVEISTHDIIKGLWNKYGNAKINMFVDDKLVFSQVADKFSYKKTGLITIDRDYQFMSEGEGRFIRMWKYDNKSKLPFHKSKSSGIINLELEKLDIRLEVFDFNNNKSQITMKFLREDIKPPEILTVNEDSLNFNFVIRRDTIEYLYKSLNLNWVNLDGINIRKAKMINFSKTDSTYNYSTQKNDSLILKISGFSVMTNQELFTYFNPIKNNNDNSIDIEHVHNAKSFLVKLNFQSPPTTQPKLFLQSAKNFSEIDLQPLSPTSYISIENSYKKWGQSHSFEIRDGAKIIHRAPIQFQMITPKSSGKILTNNIEIKYTKDLVYDTLLVSAIIDSNFINGHYDMVSEVFNFFPTNQALKNGAKLTINYSKELENIEKVGIYSIYPKHAYFIGAELDTINKTISSKISGFGKYALVCDVIPPIIKNIFPKNGKHYKYSSVKTIKSTIDDKLSKIVGEDGIVMKLDDKKVICEWHPIHKTLKYYPENRLAKGKHKLYISVTDKAGNKTETENIFYIVD